MIFCIQNHQRNPILLNTLADDAAINLLQRDILLDTKRQCMKESNTLAGYAAINLLQKAI